jgi:hypothetical protein
MKKLRSRNSPILVVMSLALALRVLATTADAAPTPPRVIQIQREWLKPATPDRPTTKPRRHF